MKWAWVFQIRWAKAEQRHSEIVFFSRASPVILPDLILASHLPQLLFAPMLPFKRQVCSDLHSFCGSGFFSVNSDLHQWLWLCLGVQFPLCTERSPEKVSVLYCPWVLWQILPLVPAASWLCHLEIKKFFWALKDCCFWFYLVWNTLCILFYPAEYSPEKQMLRFLLLIHRIIERFVLERTLNII